VPLAKGLELTIDWYRTGMKRNACASKLPGPARQEPGHKNYDGPKARSRT
jgi:hypothetical protein